MLPTAMMSRRPSVVERSGICDEAVRDIKY
jgi:hypothetical protein